MSNNIAFLERLKRIKGIEFIAVGMVCVLICLILFADNLGAFNSSKDNKGSSDYISILEDRLEKALSKIKNVGNVSVVINTVGGNTTLIATDVTTVKNGDEITTTEKPLLVGGKVVVLGEVYPEISGIVVVAGGADNFNVKSSIMEAVVTLLDVESYKVVILEGK